jgi:hypothetical protein
MDPVHATGDRSEPLNHMNFSNENHGRENWINTG